MSLFNFEKINWGMKKKEVAEGNREKKEKEESPEKIYETLLKHSLYVDQGRNGVITKLDFSQVSPEDICKLFNLKQDYFEEGKFPEIALKLLKIYVQGEGRREFELQKDAHAILSAHPEVAQTPSVVAFKEIELHLMELKRKLKYWGVSLPKIKIPSELVDKYLLDKEFYDEVDFQELPSVIQRKLNNEMKIKFPGGKIEILAMDYIFGEDLGKILLREVLLRHDECSSSVQEINEMHFHELAGKAGDLLQFKEIDFNQYQEANRQKKILMRQEIKEENAAKMIDFLKKDGYHFKSEWLERIKGAIHWLHKKGIYHRDLHERNILIGENGQVYIIDFGTGLKIKSPDLKEEEIYWDEERKVQRINDNKLVERYQILVK